MKWEPMKAVYCYYLPETRKILHSLEGNIPDELFFVTAKVKDVQKKLPLNLQQLSIPALASGCVDLDAIHEPIIDRIALSYADVIDKLADFSWKYSTSGSSEGIFHLLVNLKLKGYTKMYVLEGEYEGYGIQAAHMGLQVETINPDGVDLHTLVQGVWFISNPSARDGNIIENSFIHNLCDLGHKIILDFAYVGSTKPYTFDVCHKNIIACVMSFSKPYGVFRFRIGGFVFSRVEIKTLFGNKWFKDVERLLQAYVLLDVLHDTTVVEKYKSLQEEIIKKLNTEFGLSLRASDSYLLAYLKESDIQGFNNIQKERIKPYKRGTVFRFCLTPYFEEYEHLNIQKDS